MGDELSEFDPDLNIRRTLLMKVISGIQQRKDAFTGVSHSHGLAKIFTPPGRRSCHDTTYIIYPNNMEARKASVNTQNGESLIAHYSF